MCGQEMGERSRRGLRPLDPRAASGWPSAKVGGALPRMSGRVCSIPPSAAPRAQCLCRRVSGTVPEVLIGEARRLLRGAQRPRGGGKLRGEAAHARGARKRPERALFSAVCPRRAIRLRSLGAQGARQLRPLPATDPAIGQADARAPHGGRVSDPPPVCPHPASSPHRCFHRWVRPQPELSLQLVYPLGVTAVRGLWQGIPGGFSRGLAEVPLERPSSADFLGAQEVGPPAGAGPGNSCRQRRHI